MWHNSYQYLRNYVGVDYYESSARRFSLEENVMNAVSQKWRKTAISGNSMLINCNRTETLNVH